MDISSYPAPVPTDEQRRERLQHDIKTVEAAIELNNRLESDLPSQWRRGKLGSTRYRVGLMICCSSCRT